MFCKDVAMQEKITRLEKEIFRYINSGGFDSAKYFAAMGNYSEKEMIEILAKIIENIPTRYDRYNPQDYKALKALKGLKLGKGLQWEEIQFVKKDDRIYEGHMVVTTNSGINLINGGNQEMLNELFVLMRNNWTSCSKNAENFFDVVLSPYANYLRAGNMGTVVMPLYGAQDNLYPEFLLFSGQKNFDRPEWTILYELTDATENFYGQKKQIWSTSPQKSSLEKYPHILLKGTFDDPTQEKTVWAIDITKAITQDTRKFDDKGNPILKKTKLNSMFTDNRFDYSKVVYERLQRTVESLTNKLQKGISPEDRRKNKSQGFGGYGHLVFFQDPNYEIGIKIFYLIEEHK